MSLQSYKNVMGLADSRVEGWLLMDSPWLTILIVTVYLFIVKEGPRFMQNRQPFKLQKFMIIYNFLLVALSAFMVHEFAVSFLRNPDFSFACQSVDYSNKPMAVKLAKACWWFYFSKIIELLDTVLFVLRKKNNQISFLHVYHHSTMPLLWWVGVKFVPGGEGLFPAAMNSFIHVLMYTYYMLSAFGPSMQPYLWWKKYMTVLQLTQFFFVAFKVLLALYTECGYPISYLLALITYTFSLIVLFVNFYNNAYVKSKHESEKNFKVGEQCLLDSAEDSNQLRQRNPNKSSLG